MAPEQVTSGVVDSRCDLFAAGAILFELLAGRRAFAGRTVIDILHATLHEQPPALTGTSAVTAVDRVIRRALAKRAEERPASADAMADELRAIRGVDEGNADVLARPLTRLVVLPFRVLRPDPETDFLAFSLPDAIATSLSGTGSLIVRSSTTARSTLRRGDAGLQGTRGGSRRGSSGHRNVVAFRRPVARRRAVGRGPRRDAAHLTHGAVVARRVFTLTR
jgi:serine/threonine protein kinase